MTRRLSDFQMFHTVLLGPPGCGKTTAAEILAEIWTTLGVLKSNNYSKDIFLQFSEPNDISNKADELWEGIKKNTMRV
jgi:replication-associated recombination protein RarA